MLRKDKINFTADKINLGLPAEFKADQQEKEKAVRKRKNQHHSIL